MTEHRPFGALTKSFTSARKARTAAKVRALRAEIPPLNSAKLSEHHELLQTGKPRVRRKTGATSRE